MFFVQTSTPLTSKYASKTSLMWQVSYAKEPTLDQKSCLSKRITLLGHGRDFVLWVCLEMQCKTLVRNRTFFPRKPAQENGWINNLWKWRNLLPQKDFTLSSNWYKYLSSAPIIWAPTPGNLAPSKKSPNPERLPFAAPGSSTEYIHAKLCFSSGSETLKYQPSKNRRLVPSKWYLWN